MTDEFWQKIDRLTVSNYASSPIPSDQLKRIYDKVQQFNVNLNVKYLDQFNRVSLFKPHENQGILRYPLVSCRYCLVFQAI